jgi:hypothetical protein
VNVEDVRAMVSAIQKEEQYDFQIDEATWVRICPEGIDMVDEQGHRLVDNFYDVTTIRQLAGAFILWCNVKQDMRPENGDEMNALIKFCALFELPQKGHPVNGSRADWYARMTPIMSVETLKRNESDLRKIALQANKERDHATLRDANRALDYIHYELKKKGACGHEH